MALGDLPIKEEVMILLRQGKGLAKERYQELTDKSKSEGKACMDAMSRRKKEMQSELKAFFNETTQLSIDVNTTIPVITAALGSPFSAPAVPGQAKAFATYIADAVRKIKKYWDRVNELIEDYLGVSGGLLGLVNIPNLLPDWVFSDPDVTDIIPSPAEIGALETAVSAAESVANSQENVSKELNEIDDGFQTGVEDDSARDTETIDWTPFLGITNHDTLQYQHPITDPPVSTGVTPELTLVGINIPGYATTAEWTAARVTGDDVPADDSDPAKSKIWLYDIKLRGGIIMGEGVDYTDQVTCDARFIPDAHPLPPASYLDDRKGVWRLGFSIASTKTAANFGGANIHLEMKFYPKAKGPDSIRAYILKKVYIFKVV